MGHARKILVVDHDHDLRATLVAQFDRDDEFRSTAVGRAEEAFRAVRDDRPDLVIMNADLPDMDGTAAVRALRAEGFTQPIIMLTEVAADGDIVQALEAGANDCVTKPFRFAVLLARMRAHLRQHDGSDDASLPIGTFTFRPGSKCLLGASGTKLRLTEKETAILRYLYRAGQQVVAREVLLREVWGYNPAVTTHTLETHIYRLRQKIEDDPAHAQLLVTEGGGYRLVHG